MEALAVVTSIPGQRPEPPETLSAAEAEVWRQVASTKPHDWFTADTHPLLEEYCRASVQADRIAAELAGYKRIPKKGDALRRYAWLCKQQGELRRALKALAASMRISQQARYSEKRAATAADAAGGDRRKPWEIGRSA